MDKLIKRTTNTSTNIQSPVKTSTEKKISLEKGVSEFRASKGVDKSLTWVISQIFRTILKFSAPDFFDILGLVNWMHSKLSLIDDYSAYLFLCLFATYIWRDTIISNNVSFQSFFYVKTDFCMELHYFSYFF